MAAQCTESCNLPLIPRLMEMLGPDHSCSCSNKTVLTPLGHHLITCNQSNFRHRCHSLLKCTWRDLGRSAGLSVPKTEPVVFDLCSSGSSSSTSVPGVAPDPTDPGVLHERRLDLIMQNYCPVTMKDAAFDVTVASAHCPSNLKKALARKLVAAQVKTKKDKYRTLCHRQGWLCRDLAVTTSGSSSDSVRDTLSYLTKRSAEESGLHPSQVTFYWRKRLSCALHRSYADGALMQFCAIEVNLTSKPPFSMRL
jgi:hypothetical protein